MYEPREDSELLSEVVSRLSFGRVIDVGTGSGAQALAASGCGAVDSVVAVDIDPEAVSFARGAGVDAVLSDRFSKVDGLFDTIICNAPYLPDEPAAPDIALDGGPKGFEWTIDFLSEAREHLSANGQIILLISTLTNPDVVESRLLDLGYSWEVVAELPLSFERLLVYRIRWALPEHPGALFIARGKRGRVYRAGDTAVKVSEPRRIAQESLMLSRVNCMGLAPRLISADDDRLTMDFVEGVPIGEFLVDCSLERARSVLLEVARQCRLLDLAGINKGELGNPYRHIIIGDDVVMIDWERASFTHRPQNISQLLQYARRVCRRRPGLEPILSDLSFSSAYERIYETVARIPAGEVWSYGRVARVAGSSARAVGGAMRSNPYAPTVPCHRVVAADGRLHGFRGETNAPALMDKERLLRDEGVAVREGVVSDDFLRT